MTKRPDGVPRAGAPGDAESPEATPVRPLPWLPLVGLLAGVWATVPMYSGPELIVKGGTATEVVDHIVPGVVVIAVSAIGIFAAGSAKRPGSALFVIGSVVALAGLWMFATHFPLVLQATRDEVSWGAALYHFTPSAAVLVLGVAWAGRYWSDWSKAASGEQPATAE